MCMLKYKEMNVKITKGAYRKILELVYTFKLNFYFTFNRFERMLKRNETTEVILSLHVDITLNILCNLFIIIYV